VTRPGFYARYGLWILLVFAALVPVLVVGAGGAVENVDNDVRDWLPRSFEETREYERFLEEFGTEEMVVLSWPGATLDDPRLARLAALLAPHAERPAATSRETERLWFREVYSGPGLLHELMAHPPEVPRDVALRRLRGSLVGRDGRQSAVVVVLSPAGTEQRHEVVALLRDRAEEAGVPPDDLHMGGPTIDSVSLDVESERSRNLLSLISVGVAFVLAWFCLRRVQLVVIVLASALLSTAAAVTVLHFTGGKLDLVMIMMPPLVYVLTVSGAIHLVNYYLDVARQPDVADPVGRAVRIGRVPTLLTAATTAVGLGSLSISAVLPVKLFGIYAAAGVLVSLPVLLLFLPAALQKWPPRSLPPRGALPPPVPEEAVVHWTHRPVQAIVRHHRSVLVASIAGILLVGGGLFRLQTSVRLLDLFSPETRIIRDYKWLEERLGPLVPVEIVIRIDRDELERQVERLELVRTVHERLDGLPGVGGTLSAATFGPREDAAEGLFARRIVEEKLRQSRARFIEAGYLRETDGPQNELTPLVERWADEEGVGAELVVTGMVPLVYKAQRALLRDLVVSFGMAFVLIGGVMMLLLGSVRAGLVSMLPNVFPVVVAFGVLGWWGRPVGIGEVMTASLALGIAVDDTVHLLNWFRRGSERGLERVESIHAAFEHCTIAMVQTSVITGFSVLVFATSRFVPTASFAWLLFVLLFLALAGDLLLIPSLLSGRWGRYFERRAGRSAPADLLPTDQTVEEIV
jgi:uncharacterized protein